MQSSHGSELDQDVIIQAPLQSSGVQDEPTAGQIRISTGNNPWTALSPALHNASGGPRGQLPKASIGTCAVIHQGKSRNLALKKCVKSIIPVREVFWKASQSSSR
jgi:hypothetical protein